MSPEEIEQAYERVRQDWKECLELSIHDDESAIMPRLQALQSLVNKGSHLHAPRLMGSLLMQIGAVEEAQTLWENLLKDSQEDKVAREALHVLQLSRDEQLDWVFDFWYSDLY